jgi:hypothetical protein
MLAGNMEHGVFSRRTMISLFYIDVGFCSYQANPAGIDPGDRKHFSFGVLHVVIQPVYSDYIPTLLFRWFPRALSPNHCRKHTVLNMDLLDERELGWFVFELFSLIGLVRLIFI